MIRVICSKCGMPANLPDNAAGKMALCKCGQKNPVPKPAAAAGTPAAPNAAPQAARPPAGPKPVAQRAQPRAAAPQAAPGKSPPQYSPIASSGAAGPTDDLALQELDHETGAEKETAPVPCPACEKPLPPGEIVCRHCGFIAQEGVMGKDKRVVAKPRSTAWGGKHPSELTAVDFLKMAGSPQVFSTMVMLILRTIFVSLLAVGVTIGLGLAAPSMQGFLPPLGVTALYLALALFLSCLFCGTIMKEPFALCEAGCFGYDSPKVNEWPTLRTGFLYLLLNLLPSLVGGLSSVAGPVTASVAYFLTAVFLVPMAFLSLAQSGGAWSGLNPVRVFIWLPKLFVPYLGIVAVLLVEFAVIFGLGAIGIFAVGASILLMDGSPDWIRISMLAGVLIGVTILALHPFVYGAAMLGMLYRKFERQLVG